jgi:hypothetical protein
VRINDPIPNRRRTKPWTLPTRFTRPRLRPVPH